ncbi:PfkB family carbohydrate kinase, partial [Corynebacterium casei]
MGTLTVVGSINADLTARVQRHPNPGETLLGSGGGITAGGKGANQAVAAAYLGANVKFVGAVGQDPYVEPALKHLKESGVDLAAVAEVDDTTGLAIITVSDDGENTIVVIPGANAHVDS